MSKRKGTQQPTKLEKVKKGNKTWIRKKRPVASDTDMRGKIKKKK